MMDTDSVTVVYGDVTLQYNVVHQTNFLLVKKHTADFYRHLCNTNAKKWHISMYI